MMISFEARVAAVCECMLGDERGRVNRREAEAIVRALDVLEGGRMGTPDLGASPGGNVQQYTLGPSLRAEVLTTNIITVRRTDSGAVCSIYREGQDFTNWRDFLEGLMARVRMEDGP